MRVLLVLFLLIQGQIGQAQEISAQIMDASSKQPVPYANIIFSENRGLVTNEEGYFSYNAEDEKLPELIKISSLGYELLEVAPGEISGGIIFLKPTSIELQEVFLSDKNLSAKEIIKRVKEEVANNYNFKQTKKRVFLRESNTSYVRHVDLEVDESTIAGIDQNLMNQISAKVPKVSDSYKEVLGDLYGNFDSQKLTITKAAHLYDPLADKSLEQLTKHLETLFRNNLKEKSYLKVKSGILGVKISNEDLKDGFLEREETKEKSPEEKEKDALKRRENLGKSANSKIQRLMNGMFWKEDITFNLFDKSNRYKFSSKGFTHIDNATVYVIEFEPKRGADYKGKIYVNTLDYGVHRLEYENVKPLKKFKLFGISTADDVYRGKMIFIKDEAGKYNLSYVERESGETFGIDRPLTIIEKNKHVPGRRKQNELDLDLKLKVSEVQKLQLVIYQSEEIAPGTLENITTTANFDYQTFKAYNPEFWSGNNIMEPNAAIKSFVAIDAQDEEL